MESAPGTGAARRLCRRMPAQLAPEEEARHGDGRMSAPYRSANKRSASLGAAGRAQRGLGCLAHANHYAGIRLRSEPLAELRPGGRRKRGARKPACRRATSVGRRAQPSSLTSKTDPSPSSAQGTTGPPRWTARRARRQPVRQQRLQILTALWALSRRAAGRQQPFDLAAALEEASTCTASEVSLAQTLAHARPTRVRSRPTGRPPAATR